MAVNKQSNCFALKRNRCAFLGENSVIADEYRGNTTHFFLMFQRRIRALIRGYYVVTYVIQANRFLG
jgi:hypothetical protein